MGPAKKEARGSKRTLSERRFPSSRGFLIRGVLDGISERTHKQQLPPW